MSDYEQELAIEQALSYIDPNNRDTWVKMGAAIKSELAQNGFAIWDNWSQQGSSYRAQDAKSVWKSLIAGRINIGTLFYEARQNGYRPEKPYTPPSAAELAKRKAQQQSAEQKALAERAESAKNAKEEAQKLWNSASPANPEHPYLKSKGIATETALSAIRQSGNELLIPLRQNNQIVALQRIDEHGIKRFGKGSTVKGSAMLIGDKKIVQNGYLLAEGFATAASLNQATGLPVVVAFNAGNLKEVAKTLHSKNENIPVLICADNDPSRVGLNQAIEAAKIFGEKASVTMPEFSEEDKTAFAQKNGADKLPSDFNDLAQLQGLEKVYEQLNSSVSMDTPDWKQSQRSPWGDFPPLVRNGAYEDLKNAEGYMAAKSGESEAAETLVANLLNQQTIDDMKRIIGNRQPYLVPVRADEQSGKNKIPMEMAKALSKHLDLPIDPYITQEEHVSRTGSGVDHRLAFPATFFGEVKAGQDYWILDDNSTLGGTIAGLKGYIENNGGHVLGAAVMSARKGSLNIAVEPSTIKEINHQYGDDIEQFWQKEFGYGLDRLTRSEAGTIRRSGGLAPIRERIFRARYTGLKEAHGIQEKSEKGRIFRSSEEANPIGTGMPETGYGVVSSMVRGTSEKAGRGRPSSPDRLDRALLQGHLQQVRGEIHDAGADRRMVSQVSPEGSETDRRRGDAGNTAQIGNTHPRGDGKNAERNYQTFETMARTPTKSAIKPDTQATAPEQSGAFSTFGEDKMESKQTQNENRIDLIDEEINPTFKVKEKSAQAEESQAPEQDKEPSTTKTKIPELEKVSPEKGILNPPKAPPKTLEHKYLVSEGQYIDNKSGAVLFEDKGSFIKSAKSDAQTVNDLMEVVKAKNWQSIKVTGSPEFKRLVYLHAESQGIAVTGYNPTEADKALLQKLRDERALNQIHNAQAKPETDKELSAEQPSPTFEEKGERVLAFGAAPYQNNDKNKQSYFIRLEKDGKEREIWSIGLPEAIQESGIQVGDRIDIKQTGKKPVTVTEPVYDENGNQIGEQTVQTHRNSYQIDKIAQERTPENQEAKAEANKEPLAEPSAKEERLPENQNKTKPEALDAETISAAERMKTQNEMPTKAQIDVSEKADTDVDVKMQDVGGSSIPSEVAKASDNLKTDALSNAQTHYDKKYNRLNARAKKELKAYERTAMQVISAVPLKYRERALLNYYEHTAKHMKGTQLMLPEPLKEAGTQIGANPESTQNALQQHQSHDMGRDDEQEMDR